MRAGQRVRRGVRGRRLSRRGVSHASAGARLGLPCSKLDHCLYDLLIRVENGELNCSIPIIISNHAGARRMFLFHFVVKARAPPLHHGTAAPQGCALPVASPRPAFFSAWLCWHGEHFCAGFTSAHKGPTTGGCLPHDFAGSPIGRHGGDRPACCFVPRRRRRGAPRRCPHLPLPGPSPADLEVAAKRFGVPFRHLPIAPRDAASKAAQEAQIEAILQEEGIDLIVLARYMQVSAAGRGPRAWLHVCWAAP